MHENLNEQIDDVRLNLKGNWKVVDFLVSCYPMCRILANSHKMNVELLSVALVSVLQYTESLKDVESSDKNI